MGQRIPSKAVLHGYHWDKTAFRDNMYVRCSRCGFPCNLDRDLRSHPYGREGWGTEMELVYDEYDNGSDTYDYRGLDWSQEVYINTLLQTTRLPLGLCLSESTLNYLGDDYDGLISDTQDAVVNAGCPQCGTMLYNNPARGTKG